MENQYDIKVNHNVKRTRVILEQLIPGIVGDVMENGVTSFKMNHLYTLRNKAYKLVGEQERYTEEQVHDVFENAYQTLDEFIKNR